MLETIREPATVLWLEDDDVDARTVQRAAQRLMLPYRIQRATTASAALEAVRKGLNPAALLLDLHVPDMQRESLLAAMRAENTLADTPTWVLSGASHHELDGLQQRFELNGVFSKDSQAVEAVLQAVSESLAEAMPVPEQVAVELQEPGLNASLEIWCAEPMKRIRGRPLVRRARLGGLARSDYARALEFLARSSEVLQASFQRHRAELPPEVLRLLRPGLLRADSARVPVGEDFIVDAVATHMARTIRNFDLSELVGVAWVLVRLRPEAVPFSARLAASLGIEARLGVGLDWLIEGLGRDLADQSRTQAKVEAAALAKGDALRVYRGARSFLAALDTAVLSLGPAELDPLPVF